MYHKPTHCTTDQNGHTEMKKLYFAALGYMVLGLIAGLYYRELTKAHPDFTGFTQLSVVHTHLLALGMLFFLIVLALEKLFTLSASALFIPFFWIYNTGLLLTVAMLTTHGTMTVLGTSDENISPAISGIAGLGHILLTIALIVLFIGLKRATFTNKTDALGPTPAPER